jgi:hypothetical protein
MMMNKTDLKKFAINNDLDIVSTPPAMGSTGYLDKRDYVENTCGKDAAGRFWVVPKAFTIIKKEAGGEVTAARVIACFFARYTQDDKPIVSCYKNLDHNFPRGLFHTAITRNQWEDFIRAYDNGRGDVGGFGEICMNCQMSIEL